MFMAYRNQYLRGELNGTIDHKYNLATLFLPFTDILSFFLFYVLAIYHKRNVAKHLRYMICTALIIIGAGLVRIFSVWFDMEFFPALNANIILTSLLFLGFLAYDFWIGKFPKNKTFFIAFLIFMVPNILWFIVPFTSFWQNTATELVKLF